MKRFVSLCLIAFSFLSAAGVKLPEGSTILYQGEQRYERYGMYWHKFTVYSHNGATYLVREQSFSGAADIITDAESIARNARLVRMKLSGSRVKKLREAIKNTDFIGKIKAYEDELKEYENAVKAEEEAERRKSMVVTARGDTVYTLKAKAHKNYFHQPTLWDVQVEWDGVATGVKSAGSYYNDEKAPLTWTVEGRPARRALIQAISSIDSMLDEWAYKYKLRHSEEGEFYEYRYKVSGGMVRRHMVDGKAVRQGRCIMLDEENGKWRISGYINEREDTVEVDEKVVGKVEKMCRKLNVKALNPTLNDGEKLLRTNASDAPYWSIFVGYNTKDNINEGDTMYCSIIEPRHAAKAYDKLLNDIKAINDYLWSFLKLK